MKKQFLIIVAVFSSCIFGSTQMVMAKPLTDLPESTAPTIYSLGDAVSDFKLKNIDGKMVSLADFQSAKGFIIIFTSNHCPFSKYSL